MDSLCGRRRLQTGRLLLVIGVGALLMAGAVAAAPPAEEGGKPAEAFGLAGPSFSKSLKPVRPTPSEEAGLDQAQVPEVRLQALDVDALLREDALTERRTKVVRFGVGRDVRIAAKDGHWFGLADGKRLWMAEVVSTDALGIRLHFQDVRLPAGSELAVYAPAVSDPARGVVKSGFSRFDPERQVERHSATDPIAKRGAFWSGTSFGDRVRVEYLAPVGAAEEVPFTVDDLQHVYFDPVAGLAKSLVGEKVAGPCHNDVSCFPEWGDLARAVSGIGTINQRNFIFCTGQLLNSQKPDFTPYWLTANHCLSNSAEAADAELYWLFQTSSCNGTPPALGSVPRSVGATLVSTNPQSDYTLLMVEGALPSDLFWSGWTSKAPADGTDAVAIHHPSGDFKRISFGFKENPAACFEEPSFRGRSLVRTSWTDAPTEPGSSGSGIFRADTGQLYGQLLGGPSRCGDESFDCYGSFATTYTKVKKPLIGGSDDKSEQNDSCAKSRVVKAGTLGSRIVKVVDEDWYKISVPAGRTIHIDLGFANANGDIDVQFYGACNGEALFTSDGTTDGESLAITNVGGRAQFAFWRVFLANDTRNNYDLSVGFE